MRHAEIAHGHRGFGVVSANKSEGIDGCNQTTQPACPIMVSSLRERFVALRTPEKLLQYGQHPKNDRVCCGQVAAPQQLRQPDEFFHFGRRRHSFPPLHQPPGGDFGGTLRFGARLTSIFKRLKIVLVEVNEVLFC